MKIILGSGLIGLLARKILGPSYKIVPFGKSRFYSFNPALQDNYLAVNDRYGDIVKEYCSSDRLFNYKVAWSVGGQLLSNYDDGLCEDWLKKTNPHGVPGHLKSVIKNRLQFEVYDIRLNQLYSKLQEEFKSEIEAGLQIGDPRKIVDGTIQFQRSSIDYETIISTIPLPELNKLLSKNEHLPSTDVHFLHVQSGKIDLEGFSQVLVTDSHIDFFKVTALAPNRYLFYFHKDMRDPGLYLLHIIGQDFDILEGTSISNAIPGGELIKHQKLNDIGIVPIGASAEWDAAVDAGSAILRILNFADTGHAVKFKRIV